ncbi:MAG TPA: autoinducer binding domain-containing protein [Pararhizobium sp.]|nr:autoinducer binding domain-containing protein [Pararhizobium sp.]
MASPKRAEGALQMDLVLAGVKPLSFFVSREKNRIGQLLTECRANVGCRHMAHVFVQREAHKPETFVSVTYPGKWVINYALRSYFSIDPVINHAEISTDPIILQDLTATDERVREMLDDARRFGIGRSFVSFSIMPASELPGSVMFSFDIEPESFVDFFFQNKRRLTEAARRVHLDILAARGFYVSVEEGVRLTEREQRCLAALANGFTFSEVSLLLDSTPDAISAMVARICGKLDCGNAMHAVTRALSLGILDDAVSTQLQNGFAPTPGVRQTRH